MSFETILQKPELTDPLETFQLYGALAAGGPTDDRFAQIVNLRKHRDDEAALFGTGGRSSMLVEAAGDNDLIIDFDVLNGSVADFRLQEDGADRLVVLAGGNVGFGTSEPATHVEISKGADPTLRLSSTRNSEAWTPGESFGSVEFYSADGTSPTASVRASIRAIVETASGGTTGLIFSTQIDAERLRITSTGHVFVGSGAPTTTGMTGLNDFSVAGAFDLEGYGAIGDGGPPDASFTLKLDRDHAISNNQAGAQLLLQNSAMSLDAADTHNVIAQAFFNTLAVGNQGAAITSLAALYIVSAPTWAGTPTNGPYSIFVDAGDVRLDGMLRVGTADALTGAGDLQISGNFDFEGYGAIGDGQAPNNSWTLVVNRDFAPTSSADGISLLVQNSVITLGNTTHINVANIFVDRLSVVDNTSTVTNLASVYIINAPDPSTATVTNGPYSIFVDAGDVRFDEQLIIGSNSPGGHSIQTGPMIFIDTTDSVINNPVLAFNDTGIVDHGGITGRIDGQDWFLIHQGITAGAALIDGVNASESVIEVGLILSGYYEAPADTTRTTAGRGLIELAGRQLDGAGAVEATVANGNVLAVRTDRGAGDVTVFIIDEDGDTWQDGDITAGGISLSGALSFGASTALTLSTGAVATTTSYHEITSETGATDQLDTATGGVDGKLLILWPTSGDTITVANGTGAGAFILAGGLDFVMDSVNDRLELLHNGTEWVELKRSSNG